MFHMKAKVQISRGSPSLCIQAQRESVHCTHVYMCVRHRNREDTSPMLLIRDSYQITTSICNTCTKTYIHTETHMINIHLITCSRHIYPLPLAFRVLIPCSQTAIYRSYAVQEFLGHGLQRAGWSLG